MSRLEEHLPVESIKLSVPSLLRGRHVLDDLLETSIDSDEGIEADYSVSLDISSLKQSLGPHLFQASCIDFLSVQHLMDIPPLGEGGVGHSILLTVVIVELLQVEQELLIEEVGDQGVLAPYLVGGAQETGAMT